MSTPQGAWSSRLLRRERHSTFIEVIGRGILLYIHGPIGIKAFAQPTSVSESIDRSHEGVIAEASMLPPRVLTALYPAKNTRYVHEEVASEKDNGRCCSSYSCISPSPSNRTPPGRSVRASSFKNAG